MLTKKENEFLYWIGQSQSYQSFVDCWKHYAQWITEDKMQELMTMYVNGTRVKSLIDID
jgi:hypothetical protein